MDPRVPWKVRGLLYALQRNITWQVFAYKIISKEITFFLLQQRNTYSFSAIVSFL